MVTESRTITESGLTYIISVHSPANSAIGQDEIEGFRGNAKEIGFSRESTSFHSQHEATKYLRIYQSLGIDEMIKEMVREGMFKGLAKWLAQSEKDDNEEEEDELEEDNEDS